MLFRSASGAEVEVEARETRPVALILLKGSFTDRQHLLKSMSWKHQVGSSHQKGKQRNLVKVSVVLQ